MDVINSPFSVWESRRTSAGDAGLRAWGGTRALPLSHQKAVNCALTPLIPIQGSGMCVSLGSGYCAEPLGRWEREILRGRGLCLGWTMAKGSFSSQTQIALGECAVGWQQCGAGVCIFTHTAFSDSSISGRVWSSLVSLQVGGSQLCHICASCPCQVLLLSQPCPSLTCPALCSCFNPKQLPLLFLGWFME